MRLLDGKQAIVNREGSLSEEREVSRSVLVLLSLGEHPTTGGSNPGADPSSGGANPGSSSGVANPGTGPSSGGSNPGEAASTAQEAAAAKQRADETFSMGGEDAVLFDL